YNERSINDVSSDAKYPSGSDGTRHPFVPLDWRNASPQQVNAQNRRSPAIDAAFAINEGSRAPDFSSGPVWAIFDAAAVARRRWTIRHPYIPHPPARSFPKAAHIRHLAQKALGHPT